MSIFSNSNQQPKNNSKTKQTDNADENNNSSSSSGSGGIMFGPEFLNEIFKELIEKDLQLGHYTPTQAKELIEILDKSMVQTKERREHEHKR